MVEYCIIEGEDSDLGIYKEELVERMGEENVSIYSEGSEKDIYNSLEGSDTVVALGELSEESSEVLKEVSEEYDVISEQSVKGIMEFKVKDKIVDEIYSEIKRVDDLYRAKDLFTKIKSFDSLVAVLHDSPDPDAISSGIALRQLGEEAGTDVDIVYSGEINHQENKAMVNKLELDLKKIKVEKSGVNENRKYSLKYNSNEFSLDDYEGIALLDTPVTNSRILEQYSETLEPDIILDHHEGWADYSEDVFMEVDSSRGAVASMMADYFKLLDIEPTEKVSTALVHGIMTDTMNLDPSSHNFVLDDLNNLSHLFKTTNTSSLGEIKDSSISFETANVLSKAIRHYKKDGTKIYSFVGDVGDTDAIPQAAEYLISLEGINTSIVYGIQNKNNIIRVSARNKTLKYDIGSELRRIFSDDEMDLDFEKSAGGEKVSGGARLSLSCLGMMAKSVREANDVEEYRGYIEHAFEPHFDKVGSK